MDTHNTDTQSHRARQRQADGQTDRQTDTRTPSPPPEDCSRKNLHHLPFPPGNRLQSSTLTQASTSPSSDTISPQEAVHLLDAGRNQNQNCHPAPRLLRERLVTSLGICINKNIVV